MRLTTVSYLYFSLFAFDFVKADLKNEALNKLQEYQQQKNNEDTVNDESALFMERVLQFGMSLVPSPTRSPTNPPVPAPTKKPTRPPTRPPTNSPVAPPTRSPSKQQAQTAPPTRSPTRPPTKSPTRPPTKSPTRSPTNPPIPSPTRPPTTPPIPSPTNPPTNPPIPSPTRPPTTPPIPSPTNLPTNPPIPTPTNPPIFDQSSFPSASSTTLPPVMPLTDPPTSPPNPLPTNPPTIPMTDPPTSPPNPLPTNPPTTPPTDPPTVPPTDFPTSPPNPLPTNPPTRLPTSPPTSPPTDPPTIPLTSPPSLPPTNPPTIPVTNPPTVPLTNPPSNPPTAPPTVPLTNPPSLPPTNPPTAPLTNPPTLPPTSPPGRDFRAILDPVALQGGQEFNDPTSYQSQALAWLEGNDFSITASEQQVIQRYALASIYYATNGIRTPATDLILGEGAIPPNWITSTNWLTGDECSGAAPWHGITCANGLVTQVVLASNRVTGTFPPETQLLSGSLTRIDLFRNPVYNSGEAGNAFLGELTNLRELYYGQTNFEYNGIPPQIARLTNLVEYDCSFTLYFGPLQGSTFSPLQNLEYLVLSGNAYNSSIPVEIGRLPNLQFFYAQFAFVEGDLSFMQPMTRIVELWVDQNPGLGGPLPAFLGDLTTLRSFSITRSGFSGQMPTQMGNMAEMVRLWMYDNQLSGTVPTEMGQLARLETLELEENNIGGTMPSEVCANRSPPSGFGLLSVLEADCGGAPPEIECTCCTCCVACLPDI